MTAETDARVARLLHHRKAGLALGEPITPAISVATTFHLPDPGETREAQHVVATERRVLDPGCAGFQAGHQLGQHGLGDGRIWQAGEDMVHLPGQIGNRRRDRRPQRGVTFGQRGIAVVDRDAVPGLQQVRRKMAAKVAKADIAVVHSSLFSVRYRPTLKSYRK